MTGAARRDVAAVRLCVRRVTAEARDVSILPRRNRQSHTPTVSAVTSSTRSLRVFRVIEPRIKAAQRRKRLNLSALNIRMTDRADLAGRIGKLLCVTARARRVCSFARQGRLRRVVLATMAQQTGKPSVIAIVVFELREVSWFKHCVCESNSRLRNRFEMTLRYCFVTKLNMALRANKLRVLVSLIDFVVKNSTVIQGRSDVATLRATTRFHRHLPHLRSVVTLRALQIGMSFMMKRGGRDSFGKICVAACRKRKFVTVIAVWR